MITVQCRHGGWKTEDFKKFFEQADIQNTEELMSVGQECLQFLKDSITGSIKRSGSTGKLANAFTLEKIEEDGKIGWGIGNIDQLYKNVKYWYFMDKGYTELTQERVPYGGRPGDQGVKGIWDSPSGGRFQKGYKMMYPKKPVTPMNYSVKTLDFLMRKLENFKYAQDNARDISGKPGSDVKLEIAKVLGTTDYDKIFNVRPGWLKEY